VALLDIAKVQGLIIDSAVAYGSTDPESIALGSRDNPTLWNRLIDSALSPSTPPSAFKPDIDIFADIMATIYSQPIPREFLEAMDRGLTQIYGGEDGRRKFLAIFYATRDRESLREDRLREVTCPVLWIHGGRDGMFPVELARRSVSWLTGSKKTELVVVDESQHCVARLFGDLTRSKTLEFVQTNA